MKYKVYVTDAYYIENDGALDWANDVDKSIGEFDSKLVESHESVEEALESIANWGSRWVMYSGVQIHNEDGEEVYSDLASVKKCECCKNERWDRVQGGLYTMKKADGKKLFPEIV